MDPEKLVPTVIPVIGPAIVSAIGNILVKKGIEVATKEALDASVKEGLKEGLKATRKQSLENVAVKIVVEKVLPPVAKGVFNGLTTIMNTPYAKGFNAGLLNAQQLYIAKIAKGTLIEALQQSYKLVLLHPKGRLFINSVIGVSGSIISYFLVEYLANRLSIITQRSLAFNSIVQSTKSAIMTAELKGEISKVMGDNLRKQIERATSIESLDDISNVLK